jgi:hypothetical protein
LPLDILDMVSSLVWNLKNLHCKLLIVIYVPLHLLMKFKYK